MLNHNQIFLDVGCEANADVEVAVKMDASTSQKKTLTRFAQQKSNRNVEKYKGNKRTNLQIYKLLSHAYCLSFLQDM
jgi:hypothetical protein